jgi:Uma2 family endonuclease
MYMPALNQEWTVDDLLDLPDDGNRYEVIDGELFVTPAPALRHQEAMFELAVLLRNYLRQQRVGHAFVAPADVTFSQRRAVQPDVFVTPLVGGRRPEKFSEVGRLLLAVEVLSPNSARADRVAKRTVYREETVGEYWIVDMDARTFERSTAAAAHLEVLDDELVWRPEGASEPLTIDIPGYFARVLDD